MIRSLALLKQQGIQVLQLSGKKFQIEARRKPTVCHKHSRQPQQHSIKQQHHSITNRPRKQQPDSTSPQTSRHPKSNRQTNSKWYTNNFQTTTTTPGKNQTKETQHGKTQQEEDSEHCFAEYKKIKHLHSCGNSRGKQTWWKRDSYEQHKTKRSRRSRKE